MNKLFKLLTVFSFFLLQACSSLEPWVKPYERAQLAEPIMLFDRDPVSSAFLGHVHDAREGSRGAGVATGGGCGCN